MAGIRCGFVWSSILGVRYIEIRVICQGEGWGRWPPVPSRSERSEPRGENAGRSRGSPRWRGGGLGLASLLRLWLALPLLVQWPPEQSLEDRLPADTEPRRPFVEFPRHAVSQVDVNATDRPELCRRRPNRNHSTVE